MGYKEFIKNKYNSFALSLIVAGLVVSISFLSYPIIESTTELSKIHGHLGGYAIINGRQGHRTYRLSLSEYPSVFQISGGILREFDRVSFEDVVNEGDLLTLSISSDDESKLYRSDKIFVYSVANQKQEFLNADEAVANNIDGYFRSAALIVTGIGLMLLFFIQLFGIGKKVED